MKNSFWQGRKVLITGADGFIGGNLVSELVNQGAKIFVLVVVVDKQNIKNPIFCSLQDKLAEIIVGDIRDFNLLNKLFDEREITTCFHLAAQSIVGQAFFDPLPTFKINIQGTINVLEAARRSKYLDRLVIASTTHVYGDNKNLPYLESYSPQPSRPYETSKACADILAQTYYYTYKLPVAISRCTNTYGPGDMNFSRLVPKTIQAILTGFNPEIVGGSSKRDFIYVKDAVKAYLTLAENLSRDEIKGQAFNFGSGQIFSAIEVVNKILQIINNPDLEIKILPGDFRKEIKEQYVSLEKAKKLLNWEPRYSLENGLLKTILWYKKSLEAA